MSVFTAIGSQIWQWEPLRSVVHAHDDLTGFLAQSLWLQLYTMPEAKNGVPGLMIASVNTIAEATGKAADLVRSLLDRLIEHDLVEFDVARRVLRLTQLPDTLEHPPNPNVLRGWWRRFQNIPDCPLKAAHVAVIRWLLEERVRETGKGTNVKIAAVWDETFGTVSIPAPRRRGARRLQMNLFPEASDEQRNGSGNGSHAVDEVRSEGSSLQNPKPKEIRDSETVPEPFRNGRVPDQDLVSGSLSSGGGSGEGHDTGTASSSKPHLELVRETTPYGPQELLAFLAKEGGGRVTARMYDESLWPALRRTVAQLCEHGISLADLAVLARWLGRGMRVAGDGQRILGPDWVARPNAVLEAFHEAEASECDYLRKQRELSEVLSMSHTPANLRLS